jgi:hypothetical protein
LFITQEIKAANNSLSTDSQRMNGSLSELYFVSVTTFPNLIFAVNVNQTIILISKNTFFSIIQHDQGNLKALALNSDS